MAHSAITSSKGVIATLYTIFLCITLLLSSSASAAPFQPSEHDVSVGDAPELTPGLWKRYEGTPRGPDDKKDAKDAIDWPSDDEIKKHMTTQKTHVFYSNIGGSDKAKKFADLDEIKGVILFDSLPADWFKNKNADGKTRKKSMFNNHIDRASGVFADTATGTIFFVGDPDNDPLEKSVWKRIEFDSLVKNKQVDKIMWVNCNNYKDRKQMWPVKDELVGGFTLSDLIPSKDPPAFNDYLGYGPPPGIADPGDYQTFKAGWCGLHFRQYQKNQGPGDTTKYRFDITIKDALGQTIGSRKTMAVASGGSEGVTSVLPWVLIVKAGAVDSDDVGFAYGNQAWNTGKDNGNHACSVGRYDSGSRQGDCGFTCP